MTKVKTKIEVLHLDIRIKNLKCNYSFIRCFYVVFVLFCFCLFVFCFCFCFLLGGGGETFDKNLFIYLFIANMCHYVIMIIYIYLMTKAIH